MSYFIFECPHCKNKLEGNIADCGAYSSCPFCKKNIVIPDAPKESGNSNTWKYVKLFTGIFCIIVILAALAAHLSLELAEPEKEKALPPVKAPVLVREYTNNNGTRVRIYRNDNSSGVIRRTVSTPQPRRNVPVVRNEPRVQNPGRSVQGVRNEQRVQNPGRSVPVVRNVQRVQSPPASVPRRVYRNPVSYRKNLTPEELYKKFAEESAVFIHETEKRMASLPPRQQQEAKKLVALNKKMVINWKNRLEYLKERNKKIAEAAKKSYDRQLGAAVQRKFSKYTRSKSDWGVRKGCREFSKAFLEDLKNPRLDPNIYLSDERYKRWSGNALKAVLSGRIYGESEMAKILIGRYADPACLADLRHAYGFEKRDFLIEYGLPERFAQVVLKYLLSHNNKAGINLRSVELLLYAGAVPDGGELSAAVLKNNKELVRLLLAYGISPDITDQNGETALFHAYRLPEGEEIRELLLAAGVNAALRNREGKTALDMEKVGKFLSAFKKRSYPEIEEYLKAGNDPGILLANGQTLLHDACISNDLKLVTILLKYVDPDKMGKDRYAPAAYALDTLLYGPRRRNGRRLRGRKARVKAAKIFKLMLNKGVDIRVNPLHHGGTNLLYYVVSRFSQRKSAFYEKLILAMLKNTKNFNAKNWISVLPDIGKIPAKTALKVLEEVPENILKENAGRLFSTYFPASVEIVDFLAKKNVDFNRPSLAHYYDRQNRKSLYIQAPPLYFAVRTGKNIEIIKALLRHGAKADWEDRDGKTAVDFARTEEIKRVLLGHP